MTHTLRPATALPPVGTYASVYFATPHGRMGCAGEVLGITDTTITLHKRLDTTGRSDVVTLQRDMLLEVNGRTFRQPVPENPFTTPKGKTVMVTWASGRKAAWSFDTPLEAFEWAASMEAASTRNGHAAEVRVMDRLSDAEVEAINGAL